MTAQRKRRDVRVVMDPDAPDRDAYGHLAGRLLDDGVCFVVSPAVWNMLYAWSWDRVTYPEPEGDDSELRAALKGAKT